MSTSNETDNEARIARWRAERARVALEEKQQRVAAQEATREQQRAEADRQRRQRLEDAEQKKQQRSYENNKRAQSAARQRKESALAEAAALLPDSGAVDTALLKLKAARRRKRSLSLLFFALIVVVPTVLAGCFFFVVATPIYRASAVFAIHTGKSPSSIGLPSIFGAGGAGTTIRDAFMAREFLLSRALAQTLEQEHRFVGQFSDPTVDPFNRARIIPALGIDNYQNFLRRTDVSVDVQQGLVTLSVDALSPQSATLYTRQMLTLTQRHLNRLSDQIFREQIALLAADATVAERELEEARAKLTRLQIRFEELNPRATAEGVYKGIQALEGKIKEAERLHAVQLQSSSTQSPGARRLARQIGVLKKQLAAQRNRLVGSGSTAPSLNRVLAEFEDIQTEIEIAKKKWEVSLTTLANSNKEAMQQRRYISVVAQPLAASLPHRAHTIRNLIFWFLFLGSLYLALTVLTSSLRVRSR